MTIVGAGPAGLSAALTLGISPVDVARLTRQDIGVRRGPIARVEAGPDEGRLARVVFRDGTTLDREALFFSTGQRQHSDLPAMLGCRLTRTGAVKTGKYEATHVPGLYVAGDASRDLQLAITAAAEGAGGLCHQHRPL